MDSISIKLGFTAEELKEIERRFWAKVERGTDEECWLWRSTVSNTGYGKMRFAYQQLSAHRVSHLIHKGPIAPFLFICHTCDNRRCVNPAHLYLGTAGTNNRDTASRDRLKLHRGEQNKTAVLTEAAVRAIRQRRADGAFYGELCAAFGVTKMTISNIVNRKSWRHVA